MPPVTIRIAGMRLTHHQVWSAIDALAARYDLSPSGLAKRAGLDPTTFNRSKRVSAEGRERWPSTESLSKILDATGADLVELMALVRNAGRDRYDTSSTIPLIGFAQVGAVGFFDDGGFLVGGGWDQIRFPEVNNENAYALEVSGDSMLPLYRDGDIIVVSPNSGVRKGDRIVVRTTSGEVLAKVLVRRTARTVELESHNKDHPPLVFPLDRLEWIARIIWASQ
jgi:phage repressor protein C with HTH and peptisase S24 domain